MTPEQRPEPLTPFGLSKEDMAEMSLANALRRVVDDLFTDQVIAETQTYTIRYNPAMVRDSRNVHQDKIIISPHKHPR
jgi:fructose-1,6-bisphosphatase